MPMGFCKVHPACHSRIKDHYLSTSLNGVNDKLIIYIVFPAMVSGPSRSLSVFHSV